MIYKRKKASKWPTYFIEFLIFLLYLMVVYQSTLFWQIRKENRVPYAVIFNLWLLLGLVLDLALVKFKKCRLFVFLTCYILGTTLAILLLHHFQFIDLNKF